MTQPFFPNTFIALLGIGLLAACGNDKAAEKPKQKGVFTPYVEAHNEAKATADAVNDAMRLQEQRMQERD